MTRSPLTALNFVTTANCALVSGVTAMWLSAVHFHLGKLPAQNVLIASLILGVVGLLGGLLLQPLGIHPSWVAVIEAIAPGPIHPFLLALLWAALVLNGRLLAQRVLWRCREARIYGFGLIALASLLITACCALGAAIIRSGVLFSMKSVYLNGAHWILGQLATVGLTLCSLVLTVPWLIDKRWRPEIREDPS